MKTLVKNANFKPLVAMICAALFIGPVIPNVMAQRHVPVVVRVGEGARYLPKEAGQAGVARSLDIILTNTSKNQIDVQVDYAMFSISPKGTIEAMPLREVKANKNSVTVSLAPGESRAVRSESFRPAELSGSINKPKDLGVAVEPFDYNSYYNRYYNNNYYNNNYYTTPWGARVYTVPQGPMTDAPTPAPTQLGKPKDTRQFLPPERYYGYSVAVFVGGELVAQLDKNPANVRNFGVSFVKEKPPGK